MIKKIYVAEELKEELIRMSLQVEKLEKNMAKLTIEAGADELEKAIEKAYQKQKNKISIPGFRKGKVPRQMVEKMYGKEVFYEDAANELIPDAYDKALDECEEDIVSSPKIEVVQIEAGRRRPAEADRFSVHCESGPPVSAGQRGLPVPRP